MKRVIITEYKFFKMFRGNAYFPFTSFMSTLGYRKYFLTYTDFYNFCHN